MAQLKTQKTTASVTTFLETIEDEGKREDCRKLLEIFETTTNDKATMWGDSIVGFGQYHYKSDRSAQEGNWFLCGFSPRKANISIYLLAGVKNFTDLLKDLGTHKVSSGSCLYIKKLSDIHVPTLKKLIRASNTEMKKMYG